MAESVIKSYFPSQVASDEAKLGSDTVYRLHKQSNKNGLESDQDQIPIF